MTLEKHKKFTKEEVASWPEGHKRCRTCWEVLPLSDFHNHSSGLLKRYHTCRECRKPDSKQGWKDRTFEQTMLASSKFRAKRKGIEHTLTLEDIVIPEKCPILGMDIELIRNSSYAPSLDRINPTLGYTPDNVMVMSHRANQLKNDCSKEEARMLADWMEENCGWVVVRPSTARATIKAGNCEVVDVTSK